MFCNRFHKEKAMLLILPFFKANLGYISALFIILCITQFGKSYKLQQIHFLHFTEMGIRQGPSTSTLMTNSDINLNRFRLFCFWRLSIPGLHPQRKHPCEPAQYFPTWISIPLLWCLFHFICFKKKVIVTKISKKNTVAPEVEWSHEIIYSHFDFIFVNIYF